MDNQAEWPVVQVQRAGGTWVIKPLFDSEEPRDTDEVAELLMEIWRFERQQPPAA